MRAGGVTGPVRRRAGLRGLGVSRVVVLLREETAEPAARETRDAILKEKIMEVWKGEKGREVYGARKVWLELNRQGVVVARCTVERLMREPGISGARARRRRPRTTVPGAFA